MRQARSACFGEKEQDIVRALKARDAAEQRPAAAEVLDELRHDEETLSSMNVFRDFLPGYVAGLPNERKANVMDRLRGLETKPPSLPGLGFASRPSSRSGRPSSRPGTARSPRTPRSGDALDLSGSELVLCPFSLVRVEAHRFSEHLPRALAGKHGRQERLFRAATNLSSDHATPPQAPYEVVLMSADTNSLTIKWQPPVFDGGAPIFDYEVMFRVRREVVTGLNRSEFVEDDLDEPLRTARWCLAFPVCFEGTVLEDLPADCEFLDLRVRALNDIGPGVWSDPLPPLRTLRTCTVRERR